jgi:hypothetical protein
MVAERRTVTNGLAMMQRAACDAAHRHNVDAAREVMAAMEQCLEDWDRSRPLAAVVAARQCHDVEYLLPSFEP